MSDNVCGNCRHYHQQPANPADLAAPRQGHCRQGPPSLTVLPTQQGQLHLVGYSPLPPDYPACGQFTPVAAAEPDLRSGPSDWWDRTLRDYVGARQQGNDFAAGCLRRELDTRLSMAGREERGELIDALVGFCTMMDGLAGGEKLVGRAEPAASH